MHFSSFVHHAGLYRSSCLTAMALLLCCTSVSFAQRTGTLQGHITDARTGAPLAGATILIVDEGLGTASGKDGSYQIVAVPTGKQMLRVSYIGYKTVEREIRINDLTTIIGRVIDNETAKPLVNIKVNIKGSPLSTNTSIDGSYIFEDMPPGTYTLQIEQKGYKPLESAFTIGITQVDFALHEDVIRAEEVIVTGIAAESPKAASQIATSTLIADDFARKQTYASVGQLAAGKVAGVTVDDVSGNVSAANIFRLRAGGGLMGSAQPVIYLDGIRIDNAEVQGFSTGGQGINLLTDINPEEIESIEFLKGPAAASAYGAIGGNGVILISTRRGEYNYGAKPLAFDYRLTTGLNSERRKYSSSRFISAPEANTIFKTGTIVQNSARIYGGSPIAAFFIALNSRLEDGILATDQLDRKNVRGNFDLKAGELLSINVSAGYTRNTLNRPLNDNALFGYLANTTISPQAFQNVGGKSAIDNFQDENVINRFVGSVEALFQPYDYFTGRLVVGMDDHDLSQTQLYPGNESYSDSLFDAGVRNTFNRKNKQITTTLSGRLTATTGNLIGALTGGVQLHDRKLDLFSSRFNAFQTPTIIATDEQASLISREDMLIHQREAGIFAELSLDYKNRYDATLRLRRDEATAIGADESAFYYPGIGLAWRLSSHKWSPRFFSLLKVRAAYGEAGILPDPFDGIRVIYQDDNGAYGASAVPGIIGNASIKPERVRELEFGLDTELFHRYALEVTYYRQKADDSIVAFLNAPSTGQTATVAPQNIGSAEGWGFETLLHGNLLRGHKLDLTFTLINNWQDNEVTELGGGAPIYDRFGLNVIKEGLSRHEFYSERVLGASFNDDGTYAGPRMTPLPVPLGNPIPTQTGSFALNLGIRKNFEIQLLADWAIGHSIWNGNRPVSLQGGDNVRYNLLATQLGLASTAALDGIAQQVEPVGGINPLTPGTLDYVAAAQEFARLDPRFNANFIEDADFFRLREISVSYRFDDLFRRLFETKSLLQNVRLILSANNLWLTSKYSGRDVDINWSGIDGLERGQDFFTLQTPRTVNLALSVSL